MLEGPGGVVARQGDWSRVDGLAECRQHSSGTEESRGLGDGCDHEYAVASAVLLQERILHLQNEPK